MSKHNPAMKSATMDGHRMGSRTNKTTMKVNATKDSGGNKQGNSLPSQPSVRNASTPGPSDKTPSSTHDQGVFSGG